MATGPGSGNGRRAAGPDIVGESSGARRHRDTTKVPLAAACTVRPVAHRSPRDRVGRCVLPPPDSSPSSGDTAPSVPRSTGRSPPSGPSGASSSSTGSSGTALREHRNGPLRRVQLLGRRQPRRTRGRRTSSTATRRRSSGDRAHHGAAVRRVPRHLDGSARGSPGLVASRLVPHRSRAERRRPPREHQHVHRARSRCWPSSAPRLGGRRSCSPRSRRPSASSGTPLEVNGEASPLRPSSPADHRHRLPDPARALVGVVPAPGGPRTRPTRSGTRSDPCRFALAIGAAIAAFAAWTGRAWLVPIAMFLAVPGLWAFNWALLAAVPRLIGVWTRRA